MQYKIMFVDDEEQNLFLMEKIVDWEELGFRVCGMALDGLEGIEVFEETDPDVVFVDIRMEEMDGLTLIEELQKKGKNAVFVIVTAYDEFSYAKKAIELGAKNYLLKPIDRQELIPMMNTIKNELDEKSLQEKNSSLLKSELNNRIVTKVFMQIEEHFSKKDQQIDISELEQVLGDKVYFYFEVFSQDEPLDELVKTVKDWKTQYVVPSYDCLYCIALESDRKEIEAEFEKLIRYAKGKIYFMGMYEGFTKSSELAEIFKKAYSKRYECFYDNKSRIYGENDSIMTCDDSDYAAKLPGDEAVRNLVYKAERENMQEYLKLLIKNYTQKAINPSLVSDQMIELLIEIKSQLTQVYKDRAFFILRHQNIWNLYKVRTVRRLGTLMDRVICEASVDIENIIENKGNYSLMSRIIDYIHQNCMSPAFSATEVANEVNLSRNYFLKIFKENMGMVFGDYVTKIRMDKAKELLKNTDMTVYSISLEVGYESQYHFSRKFKSLYGVSPIEYRKM